MCIFSILPLSDSNQFHFPPVGPESDNILPQRPLMVPFTCQSCLHLPRGFPPSGWSSPLFPLISRCTHICILHGFLTTVKSCSLLKESLASFAGDPSPWKLSFFYISQPIEILLSLQSPANCSRILCFLKNGSFYWKLSWHVISY